MVTRFVAIWHKQYRLMRTRWNKLDSLTTSFKTALVLSRVKPNSLPKSDPNDPNRYPFNLGQVGVGFTPAQQDQIKQLFEAGKIVEAQRIILASFEE